MAACLLVIASLYARFGQVKSGQVEMRSGIAQWAVAVMIYLFTANFSWSWAVVSFTHGPRISYLLLVNFVSIGSGFDGWS